MLGSSSFAKNLAKHGYMRKCYTIQEIFRRICGFSAILNVFAILWGVANFVQNYFAKKILLQKKFIGIWLALHC
jgi:hypothetical protein